jgi:hypothetical protein
MPHGLVPPNPRRPERPASFHQKARACQFSSPTNITVNLPMALSGEPGVHLLPERHYDA